MATNLGDITHGSDFPFTSDDVGHSDDCEGLFSEAMLCEMLSGQPQGSTAEWLGVASSSRLPGLEPCPAPSGCAMWGKSLHGSILLSPHVYKDENICFMELL